MKKTELTLHIPDKIKYPLIFSEYEKPGDLYLTIETTGLSPERHRIISISAATIQGDEIHITIFSSDNKDDELTLIEAALPLLDSASRIITWNGDSFDFRFLKARGEEYGKKIEGFPSYDLRKILSPLKRLVHTDGFSLYSLLDAIGISDTSLADGQTIVTLFQTYISTGEERYLRPITDHSIYKLTGIMNLMMLMNSLKINKASPAIEDITITDEAVCVNGKTDIYTPIEIYQQLDGVSLVFTGDAFTGTFALYDGRIRMYYPDPASYVRLKSDGSLIPKELSKSMDKSSYEPVAKETCYSLVRLPDNPAKQLESYIKALLKM